MVEGFILGRKYFSDKQQELLERLSVRLDGDDLKTMKSILKVFSAPKTWKTETMYSRHRFE